MKRILKMKMKSQLKKPKFNPFYTACGGVDLHYATTVEDNYFIDDGLKAACEDPESDMSSLAHAIVNLTGGDRHRVGISSSRWKNTRKQAVAKKHYDSPSIMGAASGAGATTRAPDRDDFCPSWFLPVANSFLCDYATTQYEDIISDFWQGLDDAGKAEVIGWSEATCACCVPVPGMLPMSM